MRKMRETLFHGIILVICTLNLALVTEAKGKYDLDSTKFNHEVPRLDIGRYNNQQKTGNQKHLDKRQENASKKFIGRIEHGKVKVLRRPEESPGYDNDRDVCRKSKKQCKDQFSDEELDSPSKKSKIKYSIKFRHEKQQQVRRNGPDASIMRLHKNGRKYAEKEDDSSSEEDDDEPIKRFQFMDEDD